MIESEDGAFLEPHSGVVEQIRRLDTRRSGWFDDLRAERERERVRRGGPAWRRKAGGVYGDLRQIASQHCLQIRAATNISVANHQDAADVVQFQNPAARLRVLPAMKNAIGKISRGVVNALERTLPGHGFSWRCHVAHASAETAMGRSPSHSLTRLAS